MAFECAFTGREIVEYYDPYFVQLAWESQYLEVKSKNTGHYWGIVYTGKENAPIMLLHKYQDYHDYHKQCDCLTVHSAIKKIKKHDDYILNKKATQQIAM